MSPALAGSLGLWWRLTARQAVAALRCGRSPFRDLQSTITNHRPRSTDHGAPTTDQRPRTADHGPPTTDHRPPTTNHRPRTTDHGSPTTYFGMTARVSVSFRAASRSGSLAATKRPAIAVWPFGEIDMRAITSTATTRQRGSVRRSNRLVRNSESQVRPHFLPDRGTFVDQRQNKAAADPCNRLRP